MRVAQGQVRPLVANLPQSAAEIVGLSKVGTLKGVVPESSGLAPAEGGQNYFSFGDDGNSATLYEITATGKLVRTLEKS